MAKKLDYLGKRNGEHVYGRRPAFHWTIEWALRLALPLLGIAAVILWGT